MPPNSKISCFFFPAEDGIRDRNVTGVQTCALPISAVGGPPGVPDPDGAGERALAQDALEILDAPGRAPDLQRSRRREHGDTSRVIAAVLEALEALEDDAHRALVSDVADDPTHSQSPFRVFDLRLAAQPSLTTWGLRSSASAPGGTSRVITDPAAT